MNVTSACVPALSRTTLESATETAKVATRLSAEYLATAPPWRYGTDAMRWWAAYSSRRPPRWATEHVVRWETGTSRLRDFSAPGADPDVVPTLVLPPQAGHDSCIVDYSPVQSQVKVLLAAGLERLGSMDWVGATAATKDATVEDYLADLDRALETMGAERVNLVGDCQGGWLATIYAALHPERVNTLTIAGAPVDFHGDADIARWVDVMDPKLYERAVASGGGVLPGEFLLGGFIAMRPENEVERQLALLKHLDDAEHVARYGEFEDWFKHTQAVPGAFYLWIVEHLFRRNALVRGELEIGGERVDLGRIACPLFLLAGAKDHITPAHQVWALADHAATPPERVERRMTGGGHLGLFMGREALRDHWPELMAGVHAVSVPGADPRRALAAAKDAAPDRPPVIRPGY